MGQNGLPVGPAALDAEVRDCEPDDIGEGEWRRGDVDAVEQARDRAGCFDDVGMGPGHTAGAIGVQMEGEELAAIGRVKVELIPRGPGEPDVRGGVARGQNRPTRAKRLAS